MIPQHWYPGHQPTAEELERRREQNRFIAECASVGRQRETASPPQNVVDCPKGLCCLCWPAQVRGVVSAFSSWNRWMCQEHADEFLPIYVREESVE